jgi:hypothetical protein
MALTLGTNCGFVTTAPTADPLGTTSSALDNNIFYQKHISPVTAIKITEIGWWCYNATEESNFEVGLYSHNSGLNYPNTLLKVERTNAKGTTAGWKKVTVNWDISADTYYWLAVQLDDTITGTTSNRGAVSGYRRAIQSIATSLPDTANITGIADNDAYAIYAVWEAATPSGTNQWINIDDTWRQLSEAWVNVDDSWRKVKEAWINVDDVWRKLYSI